MAEFVKNMDRRCYPRAPLKAEINFLCNDRFGKGVLKNISPGGIFIITANEHEPGSEMKLIFDIPGYNIRIRAVGVVVWVERGVGMGVKFVELNMKDREVIEEYVNNNSSPKLENQK